MNRFLDWLFPIAVGLAWGSILVLVIIGDLDNVKTRDSNVKYLQALSQSEQLEVLKICYTSHRLNCNDAVNDYRKLKDGK